jgi:hypothetical protein
MESMRNKTIQASVDRERALSLDEIGAKEVAIEEKALSLEEEAFANEILTVRVATSAIDPAPVHTSVNGINQNFIRGAKQNVKRKYVEALARARTYTYVQEMVDSRDPSNIRTNERAVLPYPFEVLHDPNPKGREWLERILAT